LQKHIHLGNSVHFYRQITNDPWELITTTDILFEVSGRNIKFSGIRLKLFFHVNRYYFLNLFVLYYWAVDYNFLTTIIIIILRILSTLNNTYTSSNTMLTSYISIVLFNEFLQYYMWTYIVLKSEKYNDFQLYFRKKHSGLLIYICTR